MAKVCRDLKLMKTDLNVPVIVLAQRKREAQKRDDPTPRDGDTWGGGAPDQAADIVLYVWHPAKNPQWRAMIETKARREGDPSPNMAWQWALGMAELILTKHRLRDVSSDNVRRVQFVGATTT